ncbi:MAG TPA: hypothetical protein VKH41_10605 [Myxococcota bacterium]|nr:hypothetical protein [Myxococcota bacterium]
MTALYLAAMLLFFVGITEPVAGAAAAPHRTVQVLVAAISRSWRWW